MKIKKVFDQICTYQKDILTGDLSITYLSNHLLAGTPGNGLNGIVNKTIVL